MARSGRLRRRASLGAAAAVLLLLPVACDSGGETEGAEGGPIEVTIWFHGETFPSDEFAPLEEEHNLVVNYDVRGDEAFSDMLRIRDAGEELPDIVEFDSHLVPAFMEAQLIRPMTEQVQQFEEEDPEVYETVIPEVWEDGTYDGEIYHAPVKNLYDAIYYNVELLEEAGVEPEFDTWFDVLAAGRQLKKTHPELPAYFAPTPASSHDQMFHLLHNFGVPFDGNIPDLTSEQGLAFIDWMQTMHEEKIVNPEFVIGVQDEHLGAFARGDVPLLMGGLNDGVAFMDIEGFEYGSGWRTVPLPTHEEDGGQQMGVPRGLSLVAGTEHPDEAALVLRYLMEPEIAEERYLEHDAAPILSKPLFESEALAEAQPYFTDELQEIFLSLEAQVPPGTNTNAVGEVLIDLLENLTVTGTDESPEEVAERYQVQLDELGT